MADLANEKHLHEDFGILNLLIQAFQNCHLDLKLGMMQLDRMQKEQQLYNSDQKVRMSNLKHILYIDILHETII